MSNISERISKIIGSVGITKTEFAERLNVTQPYISKLSNGGSIPSDRTILDICREFSVSEDWLRTGEGEMFTPITRDEQIASFVGSTLSGEADTFKRRFISMLSRLDESEWEALESIVNKMKMD